MSKDEEKRVYSVPVKCSVEYDTGAMQKAVKKFNKKASENRAFIFRDCTDGRGRLDKIVGKVKKLKIMNDTGDFFVDFIILDLPQREIIENALQNERGDDGELYVPMFSLMGTTDVRRAEVGIIGISFELLLRKDNCTCSPQKKCEKCDGAVCESGCWGEMRYELKKFEALKEVIDTGGCTGNCTAAASPLKEDELTEKPLDWCWSCWRTYSFVMMEQKFKKLKDEHTALINRPDVKSHNAIALYVHENGGDREKITEKLVQEVKDKVNEEFGGKVEIDINGFDVLLMVALHAQGAIDEIVKTIVDSKKIVDSDD